MNILKIDDVEFMLRWFVKDGHAYILSINWLGPFFKLSVISSEYLTRFLLFWFLWLSRRRKSVMTVNAVE